MRARKPAPPALFQKATARNAHTYLGAKYRRIASRRGPVKAVVAVQHAILTAIWTMGTTCTLYDDVAACYPATVSDSGS